MSLKHIAEGWFNSYLDKLNLLDEDIKELGERRMSICSDCPVRSDNRCDRNKTHINISGAHFSGCGCYIDKKTLCVDCQCPGGFW
jgi:hypothetical protein